MEKLTLEQFIAEIESIFQQYTDTNDIDRVSIKGWVIDRLRTFGKNICEYKEVIVGIEGSKSILPEDFKSLIMALKVSGEIGKYDDDEFREVAHKKYITHDVIWDSNAQEYIKDNCKSKVVVEKLLIKKDNLSNYLDFTPLSLVKGISSNSLDAECYNLHPSIRNNYEDKINITNRTLNSNFRKGLIYLQYNALPTQDGEIAIPIISTGHIKQYVETYVKIKIAEDLIIKDKNPKGLTNLIPLWKQDERLLSVQAKSEASWNGMSKDWAKRLYAKRMENMARFNLPR